MHDMKEVPIGRLAAILARVLPVLRNAGLTDVAIGGSSAPALLDHLFAGRALQMRDFDLIVVAGVRSRPSCCGGSARPSTHPTSASCRATSTRAAAREQLGGVMGVSSALNACARIFGPPVAGLAYDAFAASGAAASQAAVVAIAIAIASPLLTRGRLAA